MDNAERKRNNTRPRQEKNEKDIEDRLWAHCGLHLSLLARRTSTKCIREARVCMVYAVKCIQWMSYILTVGSDPACVNIFTYFSGREESTLRPGREMVGRKSWDAIVRVSRQPRHLTRNLGVRGEREGGGRQGTGNQKKKKKRKR